MSLKRVLAALSVAAGLAVAAPAGASAELTTVGLHGWQVQSSAGVTAGGAQISEPGFATGSWLPVRPDDAGAVGTEVNALVQNGRCPNVFFSTNMKQCFGYMDRVGADTIAEFSVPWWFRTTFAAAAGAGGANIRTTLIVNGVVGAADVWVNGTRVATHETVTGDFTRFVFDITRLVHRGQNGLALELQPNDPLTMFTLDNVDWTQIPPDNNTGIQFPIQLHTAGPLALSDAHVVQHDAPDLSSADLTLTGTVTNVTGTTQTGTVTATVTAPAGGQTTLTQTVTLPAGESRTVNLPLHINHPQVWWPYRMGAQPLYGLTMRVQATGGRADSESETFGIRTITTRLVGRSVLAPAGSRQFLVNGKPIVFLAGGWSENLFLHYSSANTADQIATIENLGLNGIRTEGKQMPADFYEQMDRAGILIDGGFQCCDAWQLEDTNLGTPHNFEILGNSARAIGENLRNHPSVLNFSWSDDPPVPGQLAVSLKGFAEADFQDPLIASAEYKSAPVLGPSGEKEGPYDWVPPSYWYDRTHFDPNDPTRTNVGGAWAFDSESSAGATVATLDSIQRSLSPFEQNQLWTSPDYNQYHLNYEKGLPDPAVNFGYAFGTLHDLDAAIKARYGPWSSLKSYVEEAQLQNYEDTRAQFEAYIAHSIDREAPSTGVVYWQLNKGWPTLLWDLYNYDFDQAGSYFGAKKANEALHAGYGYDNGTVTVDNLGPNDESGLSVEARVYDTAGNLLSDQRSNELSLPSQGVAGNVLKPTVPAATAPPTPAKTYFVELLLRQRGMVVDRNTYWLSTQPDLVNWPKTIGLPQATMTQYGSLAALHDLAPATLAVSAHSHAAPGPNGADRVTEVRITNTSSNHAAAFFIRADLRRGTAAGVPAPGDNQVLPVFWSDNDVTLWPGESQTLRVAYRSSDLRGAAPVISVSAWNSALANVPAP